MKAKKKWKKLRKFVKSCRKTENCNKCEVRDFCSIMTNFAGISIYSLYKVENYLKGFDKI